MVGESPTENSYSQYYGKFRSKAPDIKVRMLWYVIWPHVNHPIHLIQDLMNEIEVRATKVAE